MHGVIVFSTRSGACLFASAFTDNFGLPGEWSTHGDGASTSPTGRSFGAMQLAGLLFAIRAYVEDLLGEDRGGSDSPVQSNWRNRVQTYSWQPQIADAWNKLRNTFANKPRQG